MENLNPRLTPLLEDLSYLGIGNFLASSEFGRLATRIGFVDDWQNIFNYVMRNKRVFFLNGDGYLDHKKALGLFLDSCYAKIRTSDNFNIVAFSIIKGFIDWLGKSANFAEVFADLEVIDFNREYLEKLRALHAEKQASLASQVEQQASQQITALPEAKQEETKRDKVIRRIEKNDFSYAFRELEASPMESNHIARLSNFKNEYIIGKTDHTFVDRLLAFVDMVLPDK